MNKEQLKIYLPSILITIAGFAIAWQFVEPAPPKHFVMAAGQKGGAYYRFAMEYKENLAKEGITLEVRETQGSIENLELLQNKDAGVDVALVQSGTKGEADGESLHAMGSLYFEPLWFFYTGEEASRLSSFQGKKMAVGEKGSGTRMVAHQLLAANGIENSDDLLQAIGHETARQALLSGEVDGAFFIGSIEAEDIKQLIQNEQVHLFSFDRVSAYRKLFRFLSGVTFYEGMFDLKGNIPDRDIQLIAPVATLVANDHFHPALADLLLRQVSRVHHSGGIFEELGQFPGPELVDFPLLAEADHFFKHGPSFFQKVLPFTVATMLDRLKILLLPLITLLFPLFKIVPPTYAWRIRSKITWWYKELAKLENEIRDIQNEEGKEEILAKIKKIETEVSQISVPASYGDQLYNLRLHCNLVREKIAALYKEG